ncbi:MAG TPA: hypothetical protein VFA71_07570 [Terriglobales bacterium]|nr:hypothetical protein [Terriglobales bacterium]
MKPKFLTIIITSVVLGASCWAQSSQPSKTAPRPRTAPPARTNPAPAPAVNITQLNSTLSALEQSTRQTALDLARLRIDKWKTDGGTRDQAQSNAQSLMSNMTNALPGMLTAARNAPTSLTANLRLYRDLNVLYEVLSPLTDSAGAVGSKDEYQELAADTQLLEASRRSLADYMESLATFQDAELARLHRGSAPANQGAAAPATTTGKKSGPVIVVGENGVPKRIVDADDEPRSPVRKKPPSSPMQPAAQSTIKSQ